MIIARAKTQNTPSFFIRNSPDIFDGSIVFIFPKDHKLVRIAHKHGFAGAIIDPHNAGF